MRRILVAAVLCATLLPIAACSDKPNDNTANPTANPTSSNGTVPGSPGASGAPGSTPGPGGGTSSDKAACEAIAVQLGAWAGAFAEAATGLSAAGNDVKKVEVVVNKVKAANSKFAGELRAQADKTKDPQVKKVAQDLATSLEKINSQLKPEAVAANPDALMTIFDQPDYAASAEAYEKYCGAS